MAISNPNHLFAARLLPSMVLAVVIVGLVLWPAAAMAQSSSNPFATAVTQGSSAYDALVNLARMFLGIIAIVCTVGAALGRFPKSMALGGLSAVVILALTPQLVSWVMGWGGGNTAATILGN